MSYVPPQGDEVALDFDAEGYTPPSGSMVALEFAPGGGPPVGTDQYSFPVGFDSAAFGVPPVVRLASLFVGLPGRGIAPANGYGHPTIINRNTYAHPASIVADRYGTQRVEHYRRYLSPTSPVVAGIGTARLDLAKRYVSPASIYVEYAAAHTVGGLRFLLPVGFVATLFGTRVVPEIQRLYPLGFAGGYGQALIWNLRQIVQPAGFATGGTQEALRWGVARAWNLRQYVTMSYDPDSGLNPPPWSQWTAISNRNRLIGVFGQNTARYGGAGIYNAARAILPGSIAAPSMPADYKAGMVAYGRRFLPLAGIEPPYLSNWLTVLNDARVLAGKGYDAKLFGAPSLVNTRRYFQFTGWDSRWFGYPMVAFGVRSIDLTGAAGLAAPVIPLPELKLRRRYVDPIGADMARIGTPFLTIHRNIIAPRWTLADAYGEPRVRNLTPELVTRGRNSEEFGAALVRLQWRRVTTGEAFTQIIPRPGIAYRDRALPLAGISSAVISDKLKVTKTGAPPYTEQTISLRGPVNPLTGAEGDGNGIEVDPKLQVPEPAMNQSVLYAKSEDPATLWGMARVTSNVIRINFSYHNLTAVASPRVEARIRYIVLTDPEDKYAIKAPYENERTPLHRMSPFTIYAMTEAPAQAMQNHPNITGRPLHVIDGRRAGGADVQWGNAQVNNQHRSLPASGIPWVHTLYNNEMPSPRVQNRRTVVAPAGINSLRMGRTMVPGTVELTFYLPFLATLFGTAKAAFGPPRGNQTQKAGGYHFAEYGAARVEHKNRTVTASGFLAERMGTRLVGDKPYMWHGLRVGPLMPTIPGGYRADVYGTAFVSYRVREARIQGFDGMAIGYDINDFAARMRVTRREIEKYPSRRIVTQGHSSARFGYHDARVLRQYIRPDGNSDQHRKGAF